MEREEGWKREVAIHLKGSIWGFWQLSESRIKVFLWEFYRTHYSLVGRSLSIRLIGLGDRNVRIDDRGIVEKREYRGFED